MPRPEGFEAGDERVEVKRAQHPGVVVSIRFSPDEADQLSDLAVARGAGVSEVARSAVLAYLRAEEDRADIGAAEAALAEAERDGFLAPERIKDESGR